MTIKSTSLLLGFGLLAAQAGMATAADWNNGAESYRRYGGGAAVPVPAPAPIPVTAAEWYVRGDLAFSIRSTGTVDSTGPQLDLKGPESQPRYFGASVAVGRYITPSIRAELSLDYRSQQRAASGQTTQTRTVTKADTQPVTGNHSVTTSTYDASGNLTGMTVVSNSISLNQQLYTTEHFVDTYNEEARVGNYAAMLNFYYDLKDPSYHGITPYVGAGIGISMRTLRRASSDYHYCATADTTADAIPAWNVPGYIMTNQACSGSSSGSSGTSSGTAYGLAASLMAGVGYEVSPGITWDTGYRFMYENGRVTASRDTIAGLSMINIGDRIDHEVRTGVRWNID